MSEENVDTNRPAYQPFLYYNYLYICEFFYIVKF
jgi:hypothetical protein